MASRNVINESVVERRLRPIYDWLDQGNPRKAVQECDKVLKKQPSLQCAQVLRGLALLRSGKPQEATQTINSVVACHPTDDNTLQALTIYFREIHEFESIVLIYEEASKQLSKNEEILSHLFMAYVRVGNYKKQQQTAMALYKLKPKSPYYFWAVISIFMQAREEPPDSSNRAVCLSLAERMVERFYKEDKIEVEAEVLTYLYILELQHKYEEALKILDCDLVQRITQQPTNFLSLKKQHYFYKLQRYDHALRVAKELITKERDNWQHYENYCSSLVSLYLKEDKPEVIKVLQDGVSWLREAEERSEELHGTRFRAPFLGLLQLLFQLEISGLSHLTAQLQVSAADELFGYLRRFGSKWCALSDVRRFVHLVPVNDAPPLLESLRSLVYVDDKEVPVDVTNMYRHLTWLQLSRCLEETGSTTAELHLATAEQLLNLYNCTQHLGGQTVSTDISQNDMYLLLAGHSVFAAISLMIPKDMFLNDNLSSSHDVVKQTEDADSVNKASLLLIKMAGILEAAAASSRANFQLKLLLIQIYNMIGACGAARQVFESLEVKSILLDTLGHVLATQSLDAAQYSLASSVFKDVNSFFMAAAKDTCEPMIQAYKFGSLTRIPEFRDFRRRLERSITFAVFTCEQMLLDLTHSLCSHKEALQMLELNAINPDIGRSHYEELLDNSDYSVKISWRSVYRDNSSEVKYKKWEPNCHGEVSEPFSPSTEEIRPETSNLPSKPSAASLHLLRLQQTVLQLLKSAYNCCVSSVVRHSDKSNEGIANGIHEDDSLKDYNELCVCMKELQQLNDSSMSEEIVLPYSEFSSLGIKRCIPKNRSKNNIQCIAAHGRLLTHLIDCASTSLSKSFEFERKLLLSCEQSVENLMNGFGLLVQQLRTTALQCTVRNVTILQKLHDSVQTLGVVVILLGFCSSLLQPGNKKPSATVAGVAGNKKGKKKKEQQNTEVTDSVKDFNNYILLLETRLNDQLQALDRKLLDATNVSKNYCNEMYPRISATFSSQLSDLAHSSKQIISELTEQNSKLCTVDHIDISTLSLNDEIVNGVAQDDITIFAKSKKSKHKKKKTSVNSASEQPKDKVPADDILRVDQSFTVEQKTPEFVKICLRIDESYQESLSNLKASVTAKIKYVSGLKIFS